jgi:serine phosphatase RsbU (regulator of sigma subunit)
VEPLPVVAGLESAARYRPATRVVDMGGDWFGGVPLHGGRLGLVVGDVAGHGVEAVADMNQIRLTAATLLRAERSLGEVVALTNDVVTETASRHATAVVAVIDPDRHTLSQMVAGHLPPLLWLPGGGVQVLDGGRCPLLGLDARHYEGAEPAVVAFPPGAVLVLYSDGLVERRGVGIDEGIARLAARLAPLGRDCPPGELADALLWAAGPSPEDDVVIVVVRSVAVP